MINPELQQYVEREILPRYDHHDAAHRRDHVLTVIDQSLAIARQLRQQGVDIDEDMAYAIAAYHDTGLCEGRDHHHEVSARIIRQDMELRRWFSPEQIEVMAQAAHDHRASSGHAPRTLYGRIVAEADRVIENRQFFIPAEGDAVTVSLLYRKGRKVLLERTCDLKVVREDGPKVWLGDGSGQGFILKK